MECSDRSRLTVLNFPVHKVGLKGTLRTASIEYERSRIGVLRCVWAGSSLKSGIFGRTLVSQYLERLCARDRYAVSDLVALNDVVAHCSSVDDGFGIVGPASHSDVDPSLDIRSKCRDGVVMHTSTRIVTIPWIDVDQVDTYIDVSELVLFFDYTKGERYSNEPPMIIRVFEITLLFLISLPGLPKMTIAPSVASYTICLYLRSMVTTMSSRAGLTHWKGGEYTYIVVDKTFHASQTYSVRSWVTPTRPFFLWTVIIIVPFLAGRPLSIRFRRLAFFFRRRLWYVR